MTLFGSIMAKGGSNLPEWFVSSENGFSAAAVGLIGLAAYRLSTKLLTTKRDKILAFVSGSVAILYTKTAWVHPVLMLGGALVTLISSPPSPQYSLLPNQNTRNGDESDTEDVEEETGNNESTSAFDSSLSTSLWILFGLLVTLICCSLAGEFVSQRHILVFSKFFIIGAIIFGGGPVVIPLINTFVVSAGWMTLEEFLVGLAVIQALPGKLYDSKFSLTSNRSHVQLCRVLWLPGVSRSVSYPRSSVRLCRYIRSRTRSQNGCYPYLVPLSITNIRSKDVGRCKRFFSWPCVYRSSFLVE